ncbi:glycosyltransferase family 4 protein [Candidatus Uhrbacteria bacterium]|nr:glycosyltransferase family 4 protein [Candidatus Uhrbacteria bacterium]
MRITIDARMMGPMVTRGIGRYVEELVRGMVYLAPEHHFTLLVRHPDASPFIGIPNVEHVSADIHWYTWKEQIMLPRLLRETNADLIHIPHWNVPLRFRGPLVITIHDLLLFHQAGSAKASTRNPIFSMAKRVGHRLTLRHAVNQARMILTPTNWVSKDVEHFYPQAASKIRMTSEGLTALPEPDFRRVPDTDFLFYVGSAYPHKHLDVLLDAWKEIGARHQGLSLVMAGQEDVFMARYVKRVHQEQIPRVSFPGRVTDAELAGFLSRAKAFVFPSTHEGFGLPPLEALSVGCPVISSDSTCLPEVLPQEGVFFFRSGDTNDMIRAVEAVLRDLDVARLSARKAVPIVLQKYQWNEVAKKTLAAYEEATVKEKNRTTGSESGPFV